MPTTALEISYQGAAANLYVVIRRTSDAYAWNGTAFEAWSDAAIATYDVALADQGGDLYSVDFPTTIAAGDYRVNYYERAGGTPAITDLLLATEDWTWNGSSLSESEVVTLASYALTTLSSVKRHMNLSGTTYDDKLTQLINGVSAEIERIVGRRFVARDYRVWLNGNWQRRLILPDRPVQYVNRIGYGAAIGMSVTYGGTGLRANVSVYRDPEQPNAGGVRLVSVSSVGVPVTNNLTFASYPTVTLMVAAINAVTGWTATTVQNVPSADLRPTGSEDAKGRLVQLVYPDQSKDGYSCNQDKGEIEFDPYGSGWFPYGSPGRPLEAMHRRSMPSGFQRILVEYRAGYETVPADVEQLANESVKELYFNSTLNTSLASLALGPFNVSFDSQGREKVLARLASYMDGRAYVGGSI